VFGQRNFVELPNGSRVRLGKITRQAPSLVRRSPEHLSLCERIASARQLGEEEHRVYVNHLVMHSTILWEISSFLFLLRHNQLEVKRLMIGQTLPDLSEFAGRNLVVENCGRNSDQFLPTRFFLWFLLKLFAHAVFRRFSRPQKHSGVLIRAYVETTVGSHTDTPNQTVVFTYPFKTNFRRQLRYWRSSWGKDKPVHLMGLPYRWLDPLRLLINWRNRDLQAVRTENRAHRCHAEEIHKWGFHTVLSDSESESSGCVLNKALSSYGIKTANVAHGVGVYGPYIFFDECKFYNESQMEYYRRYSEIAEPRFLVHSPKRNLHSTKAGPSLPAAKPVLVMLKGNWDNAGKYFEDQFENEVVSRLKSIALDLKLELFIKFHPNTRTRIRERICKKNQARELLGPASAIQGEAIFINTLSTVYYSCFDVGPVVFAHDRLQDPRAFFGPGILAVELNDLRSTLEQLQLGPVRDWLVAHQVRNERRESLAMLNRKADELDVATQLSQQYHRLTAATTK
jgi:hypothetical protein